MSNQFLTDGLHILTGVCGMSLPIVVAVILNLRDAGWQFSTRSAFLVLTWVAIIAGVVGIIARSLHS